MIEDDRGWQEVARYVHLNPRRIGRLGLDNGDRAAARVGLANSPDLVAARLEFLCGGRSEAERRAALREYTEQPVRQGF